MVVFVDLEGDEGELQNLHHDGAARPRSLASSHMPQLRHGHGPAKSQATPSSESSVLDELPNPNIGGFSAALSCYPVVVSLSAHLDLNDLHALSRTCRQFRANLLPFAPQLIANALRCTFDTQPLIADLATLYNATNDEIEPLETISAASGLTYDDLRTILRRLSPSPVYPDDIFASRRLLNMRVKSKIGACARDLVAECRRCGTVVCRNCAAKPLSDRLFLKDRIRRLCGTCSGAPLDLHTTFSKTGQALDITPPSSSASSSRSLRSFSSSSSSTSGTTTATSSCDLDHPARSRLPTSEPVFTQEAFRRDSCTCASRGAFLCAPCGQNLRSADTTYKRVWTWRSRYSTHIGGLGTGMGEGDQGQKCGRGQGCLDPTFSWVEIDCSDSGGPEQDQQYQHQYRQPFSLVMFNAQRRPTADHGAENSSPPTSSSFSSSPSLNTTSSFSEEDKPLQRPGYLRQEIEGIGGVVKKKVKKKVRVGATVCEYDDERETGRYLEREASGRERSWCGWCERVVEGEKDREKKS